LNADADVFVLSTLREMTSGLVMALGQAIEKTFKIGNGSVICSIRSDAVMFAYFGKEPSEQYLWLPGLKSKAREQELKKAGLN
jgi:hypothetical protein